MKVRCRMQKVQSVPGLLASNVPSFASPCIVTGDQEGPDIVIVHHRKVTLRFLINVTGRLLICRFFPTPRALLGPPVY